MSYSIRTREDLDRYLVAFNTTEPEIYTSYYAPDAEMALGNLVLNGRDAIIQFFNIGRPRVSEHIAADSVLFEKHAVALTATITFTAKVDLTEVSSCSKSNVEISLVTTIAGFYGHWAARDGRRGLHHEVCNLLRD